MTTFWIDSTPSTALLQSYRLAEYIDYLTLVGEATDNSIDARSTSVSIDFDEDEIVIRDNGDGIKREDVNGLFALGVHVPHKTTKLGQYGVGIKTQVIAAGDLFEVKSVSAKDAFSVKVVWPEVQRSGQWKLQGKNLLRAVDAPTGTVLRVARLRKKRSSLPKIAEFIQAAFHPALSSGCSIRLNGQEIKPLPEPAMRDVIDQKLPLSDGRSAHVRAGILLKPGKPNQVHIGYEHRIIMPSCAFGCGEFGNMPNMFARVHLEGPWRLAKFKNGLTDEAQEDELRAALYDFLLPLLQQADDDLRELNTEQIEQKLNDLVPDEMRGARPNRSRARLGEKDADRKSNGKRGVVAPDRSTDGGPARKPKNRIIINFRGNDADHGMGVVDLSARPHCIMLAGDNPSIVEFKRAARTSDLALRALYVLAIGLYVERVRDAQSDYEKTFGREIARLLAQQSVGTPASVQK